MLEVLLGRLANGYVRVVSWFDIDTGGPVQIEAYRCKGKW